MCYCSRPNVGARKTLRKAHSFPAAAAAGGAAAAAGGAAW